MKLSTEEFDAVLSYLARPWTGTYRPGEGRDFPPSVYASPVVFPTTVNDCRVNFAFQPRIASPDLFTFSEWWATLASVA